ncbi:hypothetical protein [Streptomyces lunaelactis]|uniref:hypothetical protein n=1 Tax=Streptomyces lunaelactis TaxID=1535768 RepID=UPI00131F2D0C|nr:hypothetical protein [Streptomyces lunaelactis]NUK86301.1 hypothetical protein [Streptomyces lunaelactis]
MYSRVRLSLTPRKVAFLATAIALGAALSACSNSKSEERKYAVPDSLCGVSVKSDLLSPFLPPGEKISTQKESPSGGTTRCNILVDGKVAVIASRIWWGKGAGDGVIDVAAVHAKVAPGQVSDDEKYLYSGTGSVGKTEGCADSTHPKQDLFTVIQVFASGRDDEAAMKRLIPAYTKAVEQSDECPHDDGAP